MHFPPRAALILFLSIFGHKIGVLKTPALFHGKELKSYTLQGHKLLVMTIDGIVESSFSPIQIPVLGISGVCLFQKI